MESQMKLVVLMCCMVAALCQFESFPEEQLGESGSPNRPWRFNPRNPVAYQYAYRPGHTQINGGFSSGSGGSISSSNVVVPGLASSTQQTNSYQYQQQADSVFQTMSHYWRNSGYSSRRNAGALRDLYNHLALHFSHLAGHAGQSCLKKVICEAAAEPSLYGHFGSLLQRFMNEFGGELSGRLLVLGNAFNTGRYQRSSGCEAVYDRCGYDSLEILEMVREINFSEE